MIEMLTGIKKSIIGWQELPTDDKHYYFKFTVTFSILPWKVNGTS